MNNNKEINMTNLKKLGLTALAGSLAAVSAHAGEMSVSGGANLTYTTGDNTAANGSANSLGNDKDVKFSGSGELDNGWTFSAHTTMTDAFDVSSSATVITMGSMGSIGVGSGGGTNVNGGYDETYPRAYEENSDTSTANNSANYMGNWADGNALVYQAPGFELMGASISMGIEHTLQAGSDATNDGGGIARSGTYGTGTGVGIKASMDGLTVGAYAAERENKNPSANNTVSDEFNGTYFINYSMGPVAIGYQSSYVDAGLAEGTNDNTTTAAKTVGTSGGIFEAESMSIAFNVNDDLSVSYAETEDTYDAQNGTNTATDDVTMKIKSMQVAYSMGAMSIKAYSTERSNPNYDADADKEKVNEIALGLAF